jgi:hypothetical protein
MTAALTITLLITSHVWDPRPTINAFLAKLTQLSDPEPKWTTRVGGAPDVTAVMDQNRVVVATRGFVYAYRTTDGHAEWQRAAYWAYPAGDVVVARQRPENPDANPEPDRGYLVIDPGSGSVKWSDRDSIAVWIYATDIVDLVCPDANQCLLRGRRHLDGAFTWQIALPGSAKTIRGPNPHLAAVRDPAEWFGDAAVGTPPEMPTIMALTIDGRIHVIDTFKGVQVREIPAPDRETRVAFIGDRLVFVRAERADAGCRFTVEAFDVGSGASQWKENGFDLDTARGAGCEQRLDPMGAGGRLVVNGSDARPMLVEADRAVKTWTGVPGAKVLATDGLLAVIVAADRQHLEVIDALAPEGRTLWTGDVGLDPQAAITESFIIIRDADAGKLVVLRRGSMTIKLDIKTKSDVVGYGSDGILLGTGRSVGYHPVGF